LTDRITFSWDLWSALCAGVFNGLALPLIPIVARRIGMSAAGITLMTTMVFVGALSGFLFGHLADKRPKMPFAIGPQIIARSLISLLVFARTPVSFLVVVSLFNIFSNISSPAYSSIMRSNYSDANRSRLMSNVRIAIVMVSALFSALAGFVLGADEKIVNLMFPVASFFGVLSCVLFSRIKVRRLPDFPREATTRSFAQSFGIIRRHLPFLLFTGILVFCATPDKMAVPLEPIWLVDYLHLDYGEASFLLGTVVSVASIIGYAVWARALRRANSFSILSVVVFLYAARFAALGLARTGHQLIPMCILSGLANAGWDLVPIFCIIALADKGSFSLFIGVNTTMFGIRGLIGPSLGTLLYTSGAVPLGGIFLLIAAVIAMGSFLLMVFSRRVVAQPFVGVGPALR
jgi:hypothetical protein